MKLSIPNCPHCGNLAAYIVETLYAHAGIKKDNQGTFNYVGESVMLWDTQQPQADEKTGLYWIRCDGAHPHEWQTEIIFEDEEEN
jgi:hypothetical protein